MIYEQPLKKEEKVLPEPTTGKQHIQSSQKIGLPKQQSPPSQAHSPVFIESSQIPSCINSLSGQSKNIFQKRDCGVEAPARFSKHYFSVRSGGVGGQVSGVSRLGQVWVGLGYVMLGLGQVWIRFRVRFGQLFSQNSPVVPFGALQSNMQQIQGQHHSLLLSTLHQEVSIRELSNFRAVTTLKI